MPEVDENAIWDVYNLLLLGPDTKRLRKMLAHYHIRRRNDSCGLKAHYRRYRITEPENC